MLYAWMEFVALLTWLRFVADLLYGSCDGRKRETERERERHCVKERERGRIEGGTRRRRWDASKLKKKNEIVTTPRLYVLRAVLRARPVVSCRMLGPL